MAPAFDYTSGNPNNLVGGTNAAMADIQGSFTDLKTFLNNRIAAIPTLVSSLPVSPVDGQEIYYLADNAAGVEWHLRYRAASASAYKWEFVGGSPLFAYTASAAATALTTYQQLDGPAVTVPLAGDYVVALHVDLYNSASGVAALASIKQNAAAASDVDAAQFATAAANQEATVAIERLMTATAAAWVFAVYYRTSNVSGTANFPRRSLSVRPVRVG